MVLEAAANAQAQAIVTYNLRHFGPKRIAAAGDTTMNQFFVVTIAKKSVPQRLPNFLSSARRKAARALLKRHGTRSVPAPR